MAVKKIKPTGPASDPNLLNRNSSVAATGPAAAIKNSVKTVNSIEPPPGTLYGVNNTVQPPAPSSPVVPNTVVPNQNVTAPAPTNTFSPNVAAQLGTIIGQSANAQLNGQSPSAAYLGKSSNGRVSDRTNNYYSQMQSVESERPDPFESRYESQIQGILDTIYNRKPFDINTDANYNQLYDLYKEQYTAQADKAMRDTMASMNAATGGYGSTYSGAVAQQAYDSTMQNLNDRNMQLMQLAYGMYADDRANDYNKLGAFQGQDNIEYGRYRDTVSDWQNDRNYYASQYWNSTGDDENRYQYDDSTEYGRYNDAVSMAMQLASQGLPVPDYLTAAIDNYNSKYGLSGSDAQSQLALLASQALATKGGSGSGGGRRSSSKKSSEDEEFGSMISKITNSHSNESASKTNPNDPSGTGGWVDVTGLGRLSWDELFRMVDSGDVIEEDLGNGKFHYRKATDKDKTTTKASKLKKDWWNK